MKFESKNYNLPLVSIIIPAYNSTATLEKCLESVAGQTYDQIEIIVVNDGSSDHTPQIVETWALKDARIKLINQQNGGVSEARNTGIRNSKGKYLTLVDSDDYLSVDAVEVMVRAMETYDSDCVMGKAATVINVENIIYRVLNQSLRECADHPEADCFSKAVVGYFRRGGVSYASLAKMFSSAIIAENKLAFEKGLSTDEDVQFNIRYFEKIRRITVVDVTVYYVSGHENSLTSVYHKNIVDIKSKTNKMFLKLFEEKSILTADLKVELETGFLYFIWDTVFRIYSGRYYNIKKEEYPKTVLDILKNQTFKGLQSLHCRDKRTYGNSISGKIARFVYSPTHPERTEAVLRSWFMLRDLLRRQTKIMNGLSCKKNMQMGV